ncbi:MAG: tRNA (adenosine(37)-N6)-threonylcarbamoyltransferase complex transferase subunit TsaD [bacterium]|nr:tRNA (adenosine(37)-N6)-threonylcarbamoyltransferase complex transferase subunit TsaD [bacterium]
MKILTIETSCDETSVAIVEDGKYILSNFISSQIKTHQLYGGVVPEIASRMHAEKINFLIKKTLETRKRGFQEIDAVAVTYGPGLEGSLLVGLTAAKTISVALNKPLIPVNHIHGHIYSSFLTENTPCFPFICLVVSGGHTQLVLVKDHFNMELLGQTRDDAAGEAFDKIARYLGLEYPGGPVVEKESLNGNETAFNFPRAMLKHKWDFSFSGLKTAVIYTIKALEQAEKKVPVPDICASFQKTVIDILTYKAVMACKFYDIKTLVLSGGVIANKAIVSNMYSETLKNKIKLHYPEKNLCTDNAAMTGSAAYFQYKKDAVSNPFIRVEPNAKIV